MRVDDVDEVALMERLIFPAPWPRQAFIRELKDSSGSICLVARQGMVLAGYLVAWLVCDEAHIGNVAANPEMRRRGVARHLIAALVRHAEGRTVRRITLEVRVSNTPAIKLYKGFGFKAISMRKGYYIDNREDAFVMLLELNE
ncbi:MAG: ribosomal protein S18-alanine N-acetyltransferase [Candidatus Eisenbacteria bacterium]